jgi:hypothetical protein
VPDNKVSFSIDGQPVYFDADGAVHQGSGDLVATQGQVVRNYLSGDPNGYSYACYRDVTDLVLAYTDQAPGGDNYPGYARYTVGDVSGSLDSVTSHAGWSLLLIYNSPATQGHQFFLYDTLMHCDHNQDLDFDNDGQPGGTISGFIVPNKIEGEINAAKLTCFVGEGDLGLSGDYLKVNGAKLWDGKDCTGNSKSTPNNIWNGESLVIGSNDGIDIDTPGIDPNADPPQYITWDSGIISSGDTSVTIDTYTDQDGWNLVYMILSFRSEATMGGSLCYLIRG